MLNPQLIPQTSHAPAPWWRGFPLLRLLTFLGLAVHLLLLFRPDESFVSRPFQEDAFYSLSVARSIAQGNGLTIDGVQSTNGVQPLICFLYAPAFLIGGNDMYAALRLVLLLQVLIYAAVVGIVAWFMTTLLRPGIPKQEVFWLMAMILAWSYTFSNGMLNGLETGLAVAMACLAAGYYNSAIKPHPDGRPGRYFLLGALLGLAVLTRIDMAFLVAALLLCHLWHAHRRYGSLKGGERFAALRRTLVQCFIMGATSVLISSPWWTYNQLTFGSLLPISGQAQQMLIPDPGVNFESTMLVLVNALMPLVHTPVLYYNYSPMLAPLVFIAALVLLITLGKGWGTAREASASWSRFWDYSGALPLVIFGAALIIYYIFFFGAPHFVVRYLMTVRMLIGVSVIAFIYLIWYLAPHAGRLRTMLILLLAGCMGASAYALSWNFTDFWGNIFLYPARWVAQNTAPPQKVGMFQSGTTGFLAPQVVVNLDGKVNVSALRALQAGRLPAYVDSMRFDYIVDWSHFIDQALADPNVRSHYELVDTLVGDFQVWKRIK